MNDDMVEWLRSQILARKAVAEAATKGEWDSDDGGSIHVGHPTHVVVDWIPNEGDLAHVLLQQPQDAIARCEADLLLLADHASFDFPADDDDGPGAYAWTARCDGCGQPTPCRTARLLAYGYRRRPGWNPDWAPSE